MRAFAFCMRASVWTYRKARLYRDAFTLAHLGNPAMPEEELMIADDNPQDTAEFPAVTDKMIEAQGDIVRRYIVRLRYNRAEDILDYATSDDIADAVDYATRAAYIAGARDVHVVDTDNPGIILVCERIDQRIPLPSS